MDWTLVGAFAIAELLFCLTPGPAVLYVVSTGLTRGPGMSFWANAGILIGNVIYFAISATGLSALLMASYEIFFLIKWVGAAYLVWLGLSTFLGKGLTFSPKKNETLPRSGPKVMLGGVLLQLANPKAILFFAAFLPLFIDPERPIVIQFAVLALVSVCIEFCTQAMYGTLAGQASKLAERPGFAKWIDRASGSVLIAAGVLMAAMRRS